MSKHTWPQKLRIRTRWLKDARARRAAARAEYRRLGPVVTKRKRGVAVAKKMVARIAKRGVREPSSTYRRSPNQSSRNGAKPAIIVLHATEGSYAGSVSWLCNPAADASSHLVISKDGQTTRLVLDSGKAWTQANYNPQALSIEQEGYSAQGTWPDAQLQEVAKWLAYWSKTYGIPLVHSTTHGVCQHKDLGAAGGGHHDCGDAYPEARVLALAKGYAANGW